MKEQRNDRMASRTEPPEASKNRRADAEAPSSQSKGPKDKPASALQAKGESDAMRYCSREEKRFSIKLEPKRQGKHVNNAEAA